MTLKRELAAAEDAGWAELEGLIESLSPAQQDEPGYFLEGWSVKDLMGHVACWAAEAGRVLQQVRIGTYQRRPIDVDAMNREFYEAMKDLPLPTVRAEFHSSRIRMLQEWNALEEPNDIAVEWFRDSGPGHYQEHMERLREWTRELRSRG